MDYTKYYEARDKISEIIGKDLVGPAEENEIIIDERPLDYYLMGKLYPRQSDSGIIIQTSADDCGELDEESGISLSNSKNPSSFGLSFSVKATTTSIIIQPQAARYNHLTLEKVTSVANFVMSEKYNNKTSFWVREQMVISDIDVDITKLAIGASHIHHIAANLTVRILLHKVYPDNSKTFTVSMVNENTSTTDYVGDCEKSFFQVSINVSSRNSNAFMDQRRNEKLNNDPEMRELEMLYYGKSSYASGHGCAVEWDLTMDGLAKELRTVFLPKYELLQMMPSQFFDSEILSMRYLSEESVKNIQGGLRRLTYDYQTWIEELKKIKSNLPFELQITADDNITKCERALSRINRAISELDKPDVFRAFTLANKAMYKLRVKVLSRTMRDVDTSTIKWYPFQLAFFLQEITSFSAPENKERELVDLLWFPTGGGKTEAYLGIAAFCIFLRRLRLKERSAGVTVLMRYTLRLLSFQQFERASALICACELIRKEENILGGEIGIGLWAGKSLTPNKLDMAKNILSGGKDEDSPSSNPTQIKKCPWCGTDIEATQVNYRISIPNHRMSIHCPNEKCDFTNGLPIYLIDEEIYHHKPSFIIATIDKFAQLALNEETFELFGNMPSIQPPDLIIQDELHLISGPLGTITGLYEASIRKMCTFEGRVPKIIASTATIRNAKEQIRALYASEYVQFPPQGLSIDDSYFAHVSNNIEKPSRQYIGVMSVGTSATTMFVRVMASLTFASRYLISLGYEDEVIDSFWTMTGYFNSLRELGSAIVRVVDDIQDRYKYLRDGKFLKLYPFRDGKPRYDRYRELTSRENSENIGNIIQKELTTPYRSDGSTTPFDFLLSSNMISVGVDISRLGSMVVVGQPKTTSEYIQATSRVGRLTPGLVIATYNQAKSRDRSHYEQFYQYHDSFYRFVEATSVTPFSDRARDRGLQTLFVIICRYSIPALRRNCDAKNFRRNLPGVNEVVDYIVNYVKLVDVNEVNNVIDELNEIQTEWERKSRRAQKLEYRCNGYKKSGDCLFEPDYQEGSRFRVLNSMRSVETMIDIVTED